MPKRHSSNTTGASPSGKAAGFDPAMRWFESSRPCHFPLLYFIRIPSVDTGTCSVSKMMVFTGNANPDLARRVVRQLHIPLGDVSVGKFSDGEISVEINENVRGNLTALAMLVSLGLLGLAMKHLPLGTAYAVWTGVGAVGTVIAGIVLFGESMALLRLASVALIVCGLVGLKLSH